MISATRKANLGSLFTGLMLIAIGTLFLLDRLHFADFGDIFRMYWPSILILMGLAQLFQYRSIWSSLWMIAVGAWLQSAHLHLFGLTYRNSWPLLLIVLGAGITLRALLGTSTKVEGHES